MSDLRPSFDAFQAAFGLPAVVRVPDGSPVSTTIIWAPPQTDETPAGMDVRRAAERRILSISRADVPQVPRGTIVTVAEDEDGEAKTWRVDSMDHIDSDHHGVVVVEAPAEEEP